MSEIERIAKAAQLMRQHHGPEHDRHAMWTRMAEWLTVHAMYHDDGDVCDWTDMFVAGGECAGLAVADAYLDTRPSQDAAGDAGRSV